MLLVDRVLEWVPGQRAVALKNVSGNEPYFVGHYPQVPLMPGVLIVEAMAQVSGIALATAERIEVVPLLAGIDKARFRRPVTPGDQLKLEAEALRSGKRVGKVAVRASVAGEPVAEAELLFTYISPSELSPEFSDSPVTPGAPS
jgi:3-hydroxyacyl-[acyl-carrier-protein] dehydratase